MIEETVTKTSAFGTVSYSDREKKKGGWRWGCCYIW